MKNQKNNSFFKRFNTFSDEKLLKIAQDKTKTYADEAISAAQEILIQRGHQINRRLTDTQLLDFYKMDLLNQYENKPSKEIVRMSGLVTMYKGVGKDDEQAVKKATEFVTKHYKKIPPSEFLEVFTHASNLIAHQGAITTENVEAISQIELLKEIAYIRDIVLPLEVKQNYKEAKKVIDKNWAAHITPYAIHVLIFGAIVFGVGLLVTLGSDLKVIFYGPIVLGAFFFIAGLFMLLKSNYILNKKK